MLTILGFLWRHPNPRGPQYTPEHANAWARMLHRNITIPHRFVLLTDQPEADYDPLIQPVKLWDDWREIRNPKWGDHKPHCYCRLKAFSAAQDVRDVLGDRYVSIDLDVLVLGNLDAILSRSEDFLILHRFADNARASLNTYLASMWMMNTGARPQVWDDFNGLESIKAANHFIGSDQAWIRFKLGPNEAGWTHKDGVFSWPNIQTDTRFRNEPPPGAKIIFYNGTDKPWNYVQPKFIPPPPGVRLRRRDRQDMAARFKWVGECYG